MTLRVNGEPTEVPDGLTVLGLVERLGTSPEAVAVAVELEVVPRRTWATRTLQPGQSVEVVRAVGGG